MMIEIYRVFQKTHGCIGFGKKAAKAKQPPRTSDHWLPKWPDLQYYIHSKTTNCKPAKVPKM